MQRLLDSGRARAAIGLTCGVAILAPLAGSTSASAEEGDDAWAPGTPPLSTPWTDEVGPDNALPEYPRPQMTRDRWENLNGVWEFAPADVQAPPTEDTYPTAAFADDFGADHHEYAVYAPPGERHAGQFEIGDGELRVSSESPFFSMFTTDTSPATATSALTLEAGQFRDAGSGEDSLFAALVQDEDTFLGVWYNNTRQDAGFDVVIDGAIAAGGIRATNVDLNSGDRLALTVDGDEISGWAGHGDDWTFLFAENIGHLVALSDPDVRSSYTYGFGLRGAGGEIALDGVSARVSEDGPTDPSELPPVGQELDERILVPYPVESALSGIQRREQRMWYRRTFDVPDDWRIGSGERLLLHFGAVDYDAKVWVNGEQVTTHRGGYDKFSVDITDALVDSGPQELIVWAEDLTDATFQPIGKQRRTPDRGIFYEASSGIWQTVWMEPVSAGHIERLDMTPQLAPSHLLLTPRVTGTTDPSARVQVAAYDGDRMISQVAGPVGEELRVPVPDAKLWSPDDPFLYDLRVRLYERDVLIDEVESYFGMREIGMAEGEDGKLRMTLNGDIVFHMSTLDQGYWPDGLHTAPTDEALRFDLEAHKELGFNTVRKHIKVEPDRWFYHADQLGLLVWQDMPSSKTERIPPEWQGQFEDELFEMVDEHKSWTSIVAWVPFNEGWGEYDRERTGELAEEIKEFDPTRLVNAHSGVNCCASLGDSGKGDMLDWHAYVGPAQPAPDENRVSVDGEHGGFGLEVDGHMWFGEGHAYEMTPDSATLTRRYVENQEDVLTAAKTCGISGAVYTQITDVEHEVNGFFTYDRRVEKMDFDQVREINEKIIREADGTGTGGPEPDPGTPGLDGITFYPFSEGEGTTTADAVGDHDATLIGNPAWVTGVEGHALEFDGGGQYVDAGAPVLDTSGSYSVSAWVKLDRADGAFQTAVSQDGDSASAFFLQYSGADRRLAFSFPSMRVLAPEPPETGRWYHMVGVRDVAAGTAQLYLDGELVGTRTSCFAGEATTGNTVIGRAKFGGNQVDFLDGAVDEVRLFDRALSEEEVATLHGSQQD